MKDLKSHFWFNKSQRNGIFFLALLIVLLQLVYFFVVPMFEKNSGVDDAEISQFQQEIDSLKQIKLAEKDNEPSVKIYPFNPSFLTDFKGYQLGMTPDEIDRLLKHRADGKFVNSAKEFQEITKVSDSLLAEISPYFKFPDWVTNPKKKLNNWADNKYENQEKNEKPVTKVEEKPIKIRDLNKATAEDLQLINGIGEKLSQRIISYRTKLGGFLINQQLYEVYYLDKEVADKVLAQFKILSTPAIKKINVNTATFKEVLSIIYIDYELTKKIFEYRDEVAEIQSLEELKKIPDFPIDKFDRIALYLEAK
ncbi:helix-hairpin-helix domain-containing protein [Aureibaculum sp. 2210JD6-5]|uniref:ComEA family DNA-binding protein n=1 Tax=Aureibaculum sp. 2210JD6-5 TaxID=3103957 RepID=UPI002AAD4B15|nr:helix-hairpin-helix domain-containing protein [Aureibaculum sp. 2210JD6-5]MDY7393689.1 helix-hairpin-helix domain-containing protein [Aureibaculum sp. 2210JD6-5]